MVEIEPPPSNAGTARLLVQCADRPGIVAAVSRFLYEHGANIVQADQYSSAGGYGRFFMRSEFELGGLDVPSEELERLFEDQVAPRFDMDWRISLSDRRPRVGILVSRSDHCLLDLLWRWRRGELPIEIPLVISNHDRLRGDVESFGVPFRHLSVTPDTKGEQEREVLEQLRETEVDLVVMARYMQILSGAFIEQYPSRVINIHHSFLPAFAGADPYGRAFERGVKIIGATAHYATEELDEGPIIEQDVVRVSHRDTREDLVRHGREVERSVLARAVQWHIEDRVFVHGHKTVVFR
ncbi:MAG: formyltetrahydrofolate deformylase [Dehalococcoidia bacterium]|nr:formyltetrahydrofolate deformylase [Dehalococcoidia bacterium]